MATNEDLYPSAAALGRLDKARAPKPPKLDCLLLRLKNGEDFYYSYRHIGAVRSTVRGELILLCTCGVIDTITIRGRNLRLIAPAIAHSTLAELDETDVPRFIGQSEVIVSEITIKAVEKRQQAMGK
ncbi:MAG TPA: hypothetical protein PKI32_03085 [Opitutales bacterium]|nr:hypothetical protein [Opitutales bacterium]